MNTLELIRQLKDKLNQGEYSKYSSEFEQLEWLIWVEGTESHYLKEKKNGNTTI